MFDADDDSWRVWERRRFKRLRCFLAWPSFHIIRVWVFAAVTEVGLTLLAGTCSEHVCAMLSPQHPTQMDWGDPIDASRNARVCSI